MQRRGFTVVELVVVLTIFAILASLSIFGLQRSQANSRNSERASDIEVLQRGLEERYNNGNSKVTGTIGTDMTSGSYPSVDEMRHISGELVSGWSPQQSPAYWEEALPGVSISNLTAPNNTLLGYPCKGYTGCSPPGTSDQVLHGRRFDNVVVGDGANSGRYLYEPIDTNNNICISAGPCVRYNLYYLNEAGMLLTVKSKHQ